MPKLWNEQTKFTLNYKNTISGLTRISFCKLSLKGNVKKSRRFVDTISYSCEDNFHQRVFSDLTCIQVDKNRTGCNTTGLRYKSLKCLQRKSFLFEQSFDCLYRRPGVHVYIKKKSQNGLLQTIFFITKGKRKCFFDEISRIFIYSKYVYEKKRIFSSFI